MTAERFPLWEEPRIRLWERLSQGAIQAAGKWCGYQLAPGVLILSRFEPSKGIVIRLARQEKPVTEQEQEAWEREQKLTEHFLGMGRSGTPWQRREDPTAKGAAVLYEDFGT